jgi:hypothetical protein
MPAPIFPYILSPTAVNRSYINYLIAKIIQAFPKALQTFPATFGIFQDLYPEKDIYDRRAPMRLKKTLIIHPKRTIFGFKDISGTIRAVFLILPLHDTYLNRLDNQITFGQTGEFCRAITQLTSENQNPAIGFYLQGPAGSASPDFNRNIWDFTKEHFALEKYDPFKYVKGWGLYQASKCLEILNECKYHSISLKTLQKTILVPVKPYIRTSWVGWLKNAFLFAIKRLIAVPLFQIVRYNSFLFLNFQRENPLGKKSLIPPMKIKTSISLLQINNCLLLNMPGEPFLHMGRNIEKIARKQSLDADIVACVELCNDSMGYLFDDEKTITEQDGYEPSMSFNPLMGLYLRKWIHILLDKLNNSTI